MYGFVKESLGAASNTFNVTVSGVVKGRSSHWRRRRRLNKRTPASLENFKRIFDTKHKGKKGIP